MKSIESVVVKVLVWLTLTTGATAAPNHVNYQGRISDSENNPVPDGIYSIGFHIYNTAEAGVPLWSSFGQIPILTNSGLFNHVLGSTNPLPDSLSSQDSLFLGVIIDLDQEISPRTAILSTFFSYHSKMSDTARYSLDRTTDAGELTTGTLDTSLYSAYSDLIIENRVGGNSDQLAVGDHSHTSSDSYS